MGGERASTARRRLRGAICCNCRMQIPEPHAGRETFCARCDPARRRVLLNFQQVRELWVAHFIEADCRTLIGTSTRWFHFSSLEALRAFVIRCAPDDPTEFDSDVRRWGRGSIHCRLTAAQYAKLTV